MRQIGIEDLSQLKGEAQIAAFRILSPERKAEIWQSKFLEVKKLRWTEKEISHIEYLSGNIDPKWFENNTNENKFYKDMLYAWMKDWTNYCRDSLGWLRELVYSLCCRIDLPVSSNGYLAETIMPTYSPSSTRTKCKCSTMDDWCSGTNRCASGNCDPTALGCGLLLSYDCDGLCGAPPNK